MANTSECIDGRFVEGVSLSEALYQLLLLWDQPDGPQRYYKAVERIFEQLVEVSRCIARPLCAGIGMPCMNCPVQGCISCLDLAVKHVHHVSILWILLSASVVASMSAIMPVSVAFCGKHKRHFTRTCKSTDCLLTSACGGRSHMCGKGRLMHCWAWFAHMSSWLPHAEQYVVVHRV